MEIYLLYYMGLPGPQIQLLKSTYCTQPPMTLYSTHEVYLQHTTTYSTLGTTYSTLKSLLATYKPQYLTLLVYLLHITPNDHKFKSWRLLKFNVKDAQRPYIQLLASTYCVGPPVTIVWVHGSCHLTLITRSVLCGFYFWPFFGRFFTEWQKIT